MGCCYSCKEDSAQQDGDINERSRLLHNPVSNNTSIQRVHSDDFIPRCPNSLPKKTDEQSALNRILQETATNVIDVAALDPHNLEQHEYLDRIKHYAQRIQTLPRNENYTRIPCILQDVPAPEKFLSSDIISYPDITMMQILMERANKAVDALKVEHIEDLVVPLGTP